MLTNVTVPPKQTTPQPFSNNVTVPCPDYEVAKLRIAHVPEGRGLFPQMTVQENLTLGGYLIHDRAIVKQRIDRTIEMFPRLKDRRTQIVGTMSGGEQQMVAIGRGLMVDPKLWLLDEPSLGLAPLVVDNIFAQLKELAESGNGPSILIVEQRVDEALDLCSRGYVIQGGEVIRQGSSDELRSEGSMASAFLGEAADLTTDTATFQSEH
jgi:branched-chain amino acid transport system ATP-binding protein